MTTAPFSVRRYCTANPLAVSTASRRSGMSAKWPFVEATTYEGPRIFWIVGTFVGDSTMTSEADVAGVGVVFMPPHIATPPSCRGRQDARKPLLHKDLKFCPLLRWRAQA